VKTEEVESLFTLAGLPVLAIKPLVDGYGYHPDDPRFYDHPPRCVWHFVKTIIGWVEIGWRKRVISIDWKHTDVRLVVTQDAVTKGDDHVHAADVGKALEYLTALRKGAA
jgi:hypothetical protein